MVHIVSSIVFLSIHNKIGAHDEGDRICVQLSENSSYSLALSFFCQFTTKSVRMTKAIEFVSIHNKACTLRVLRAV